MPFIPQGCDQQGRQQDGLFVQAAEASTEIGAEQRFLKPRREPMSPLCGFFAVALLALSAWGVLALIGAAVRATL